ncbi:thioredoxin domain-containing protein [Microbacterium sp. NPDC055910]|uniref:thioredoxin domain-containing protein n=1 Tax=Microbacterium sp. NPDC055910 TaxID=3345659 RepID=UPI0035DF7415
MNERLSLSTSPYLRAHADNPVAWHAWGEAAFSEARRRDVPVLVSIGYSTCHWCHVMARESFADAATAADLDAGFVAIKVDREEHPEVDAAYMAAAAAFTPSLGWPLTVFTTPEGRPFFAGTYFPPEPRGGLPAFRQVLAAVREAWTERRGQVDGTAEAILDALSDVRANAHDRTGALPDAAGLRAAARALATREDPEHAGFWSGDAGAPKFPVATGLGFLLSRLVRTTEPAAAAVAHRALRTMADSPLRDPVEGGFFRYATRRDWTVPHYERMLTDNALLLDIARDTGDERTARGIVAFLTGVLQQPSGGFGAAQDSESWIDGARSEGGYYRRDDRAGLEPPLVDGKIVTGWNGLAIGALARAGARFGEHEWISAAAWAADAVLGANTRPDGTLVRASLDEIPSQAVATLADYGQLATGLVALAVATGDPAAAVRARGLVEACLVGDEATVPGGGDPVLAAQGVGAPDAASDGDEPSGVAALADAATQLWLLGAGDASRLAAERLIARHTAAALAQPLAHGALLRVAALLAGPPRQVVVIGDAGDPLARAAHGLDADVVAVVTAEQAAAWARAGFALFADKAAVDDRATAYDCRDFACRLPTTDPARLRAG